MGLKTISTIKLVSFERLVELMRIDTTKRALNINAVEQFLKVNRLVVSQESFLRFLKAYA
ncbi:MAG: hypothetical protein Q7S59_01680 [Sulfurimonas sp.]|nr:hypothetical protein [Sulfurimonas sp.]